MPCAYLCGGLLGLPGCPAAREDVGEESSIIQCAVGRLFGRKRHRVTFSPIGQLPAESGSSRMGPTSLLVWTDTAQEKNAGGRAPCVCCG